MDGKARLIVLDIETYRTRDVEIGTRISQEAIEARPAKNALKELKMEWDTEAARAERAREALAKTSVDPLRAEILCVCVKMDGVDDVDQVITFDGMERPERDMLGELAEGLDDVAGPKTVWIGHNVSGFDFPVLLNRWRKYGIRPPEHFPVYARGHWRGWVFDTMDRTPAKTPFTSLVEACEAMGLPSKTAMWRGEPFDGSKVGAAFEASEFNLIREYCAADVLIEYALYQKLTCGDTWGTFGLMDEIAAQLAEIEASGERQSVQALAKLNVLERAGLVPRVAS